MIGCASCASKTQQHFASWRDAVSPGRRPSTTRLPAADASARTTGGDATTFFAATAAPTRTASSLPSAHAGAITATAGCAHTATIRPTAGARRTDDARKHSAHNASHTAGTAATVDGHGLRPQCTNTDAHLRTHSLTTWTTGGNTYFQFTTNATSIPVTSSLSAATTSTTITYSATVWPTTTSNNTRNVHTTCTLFTTSTGHASISNNRPHSSTTYDPNLQHPTTCASHNYFRTTQLSQTHQQQPHNPSNATSTYHFHTTPPQQHIPHDGLPPTTTPPATQPTTQHPYPYMGQLQQHPPQPGPSQAPTVGPINTHAATDSGNQAANLCNVAHDATEAARIVIAAVRIIVADAAADPPAPADHLDLAPNATDADTAPQQQPFFPRSRHGSRRNTPLPSPPPASRSPSRPSVVLQPEWLAPPPHHGRQRSRDGIPPAPNTPTNLPMYVQNSCPPARPYQQLNDLAWFLMTRRMQKTLWRS